MTKLKINTKNLPVLAASALTLVACSEKDYDIHELESNDAINFDIYVSNPQSRALAITGESLQEFGVFAFHNGNTHYYFGNYQLGCKKFGSYFLLAAKG